MITETPHKILMDKWVHLNELHRNMMQGNKDIQSKKKNARTTLALLTLRNPNS